MLNDNAWNRIRNLQVDNDPGQQFLESSKLGRHDDFPGQEAVVDRMMQLLESLPYTGYAATALPEPERVAAPLSEVVTSRISARALTPQPITMAQLASLLHHAYGITRSNEGTAFTRPFRVAPSGGGLYPLEIYFHSKHVTGLPFGLYHYNPAENVIRLLRDGDQTPRIAEAFVEFQSHVVYDSSLLIFLTALFERSTFKYGTRGYRFVLLEAGHVAQNINLVATGLGLGCLNIGGYYDRAIDGLLGLDGVTHSTIYVVAICKRVDPEPRSPEQ